MSADETTPVAPLPGDALPVPSSGSNTARRLRPPPAIAPAAAAPPPPSVTATYKSVFLKGVATLLPTLLTLWVISAAYGFMNEKIAAPLAGVIKRQLVETETGNRAAVSLFDLRPELARPTPSGAPNAAEAERLRRAELEHEVSRRFPLWVGFALAVIAIFVVGFFISGFMGRQAWTLMEGSLLRIPLVGSVYPSAKQMVEFILAGEESRKQFSAVVAIEYPRPGLWTIGYVTGRGIEELEGRSGEPVRAVFLPASPTSMTGYVVIAKLSEIVELDITVDEALKFTISGGVVSPTRGKPKGVTVEATARDPGAAKG